MELHIINKKEHKLIFLLNENYVPRIDDIIETNTSSYKVNEVKIIVEGFKIQRYLIMVKKI